MKLKLVYPAILFCIGGFAYALPHTINWSSSFFAEGKSNMISDGITTFEAANTASPPTHTMTFELGHFASGAPPADRTAWAADWVSLDTAAYNYTNENFSASVDLADNATFAAGAQAYVWGYNNKAVDGDTEWVLIADDSWKYPEIVDGAPPFPLDWTVGLAATDEAIVGSINGVDFHIMTENGAAVPEPSSVLLALGASAVFILMRRRQ